MCYCTEHGLKETKHTGQRGNVLLAVRSLQAGLQCLNASHSPFYLTHTKTWSEEAAERRCILTQHNDSIPLTRPAKGNTHTASNGNMARHIYHQTRCAEKT